MAGRHDLVSAEHAGSAPFEQIMDSAVVPEPRAFKPLLLGDCRPIAVTGDEPRLREQTLQLPADQRFGRLAIEKYRELEARRAGVQNEDSIGHGITSGWVCQCVGHARPSP